MNICINEGLFLSTDSLIQKLVYFIFSLFYVLSIKKKFVIFIFNLSYSSNSTISMIKHSCFDSRTPYFMIHVINLRNIKSAFLDNNMNITTMINADNQYLVNVFLSNVF